VAFRPQDPNAPMTENNTVKAALVACAFVILVVLIWNGGL
jgi:hypothetical protein